MAESFYAKITPVQRPGGPVDPGFGQRPGLGGPVDPGYGVEGPETDPPGVWPPPGQVAPPIAIPPLPGVWPPPGKPALPIYLPKPGPGHPENPIHLEPTPEHPIALPPGSVWPPLPPDLGLSGKTAILIWVVGVGARWYIYESPVIDNTPPGTQPPQPKGVFGR